MSAFKDKLCIYNLNQSVVVGTNKVHLICHVDLLTISLRLLVSRTVKLIFSNVIYNVSVAG